ncbi:CDGSH iron-sulfur domain-containing protein [Micromonospora sp. WMMD882]|uniref:CDGSH iron-sulfur domain-containing protein n=1 Tax=Micromonospora sp. WMMD882 TaxID=3015151 RepID=UPI00248AFB41|nr:CDGSH iron-sulfur domain-containing protein [Micromonospora sp. WMMD882]WBB81174.1 CDGSH iron-sulfur domain-containing protein [Micromonospora sp. WMMD882]
MPDDDSRATPDDDSDDGTATETAATITAYPDGPLLVRGDFALLTPDGQRIDARRGTVALCRCGQSALKPFCDGSHQATGFRAD